MRRKQMLEEKAMERDLMKERIREETKGKISIERENADVHLRYGTDSYRSPRARGACGIWPRRLLRRKSNCVALVARWFVTTGSCERRRRRSARPSWRVCR